MQTITPEQIESFSKFIKSHKAFLIAGHKEPDGDCIGSSLGMEALLKKLNKPCTVLNAGPFKRSESKSWEKYFKGQYTLLTDTKKETGLIIVDCSETHRLGDIENQLTGYDTFIVDHHKTADTSMPDTIIDPSAPAACLLVQQLYEALIGPVDAETARILFFGLATDTGFFRFLDTTGNDTFMAAARLVQAGANPRLIYDEITGGKPYSTRKLLGAMLNHAERYYNGRLVITYETMEDTRNWGQEGRDSDALYSTLLASEGVEAVVFVRQETAQTCTIGLRSRNDVDVSSVAQVFGGGGHKNASGASTEGTLDNLIPRIKKEFERFFN